MITFGRAYKVGDSTFGTLHEAQRYALGELLGEMGHPVIDAVLDHLDEVVNILTTKESSLPRARRQNGGTKRRPAAKPQEAAA